MIYVQIRYYFRMKITKIKILLEFENQTDRRRADIVGKMMSPLMSLLEQTIKLKESGKLNKYLDVAREL